MDQVCKQVIEALLDFELITKDFLSMMASLGVNQLVGIGVGLVVAKILVGTLGIVGWIGAAIAAVAVFAYGIYKFIKNIVKKTKYRIETFKRYSSDEKNNKEIKRFADFNDSIANQLRVLNDYIKLYAMSSNQPQECILSIADNYYIFLFTKNNTTGKYGLSVVDIDDHQVAVCPDITSALSDVSQCTDNNVIFKKDNYRVYLMNTGEDESDLTSYHLVVSSISLEEYNNKISQIIRNAIVRS